MRLPEGALYRVELAAVLGEPFHRTQDAPVCLDGEHQAGAHWPAVELHRAGAADAMLAAHVRAGHARLVTNEVRQKGARLDLGFVHYAVDLERDPHDLALSIARRTSSVESARRYSSSIEPAASAAASAASAPPARAASASRARRGAGPARSSEIAAQPSDPAVTAAPAIAQSPCVRACSMKALPAPSGSGGTSISTSSSSSSSAEVSAPRKNSSAASVREPRAERTWKRASSAVSATGSSAAGSAWAGR